MIIIRIIINIIIENVHSQLQGLQQPRNITRTEGETSVIISCEIFAFQDRVVIWRINGVDHTRITFPSQYTQTASGLTINQITRELDGTSYQCLLPLNNDLSVEESNVGFLKVTLSNMNGKVSNY